MRSEYSVSSSRSNLTKMGARKMLSIIDKYMWFETSFQS